MSDYEYYECECGRQHPVGVACAIGKRSRSFAAPPCCAEPGEWRGKCEACGEEYNHLPKNDEGVCAKCGCHSVMEVV